MGLASVSLSAPAHTWLCYQPGELVLLPHSLELRANRRQLCKLEDRAEETTHDPSETDNEKKDR